MDRAMNEGAYRGGIATRDGWAARFERETGKNWYAHISPGGKRRPRHTPKGKGLAARGGRIARTKPERRDLPTRFS